jgi:hypothetical protein
MDSLNNLKLRQILQESDIIYIPREVKFLIYEFIYENENMCAMECTQSLNAFSEILHISLIIMLHSGNYKIYRSESDHVMDIRLRLNACAFVRPFPEI